MEKIIITKTEAADNGVDLSMIAICRQIRRLAMLDRIILDENVHRDNVNNKHLFSYIEYCGLKPLEYIKSYLANLQPYMLEHRVSQEKADSFVCVLDNAYRISLYIKLDKTRENEIIVSFHENVVRGIAKENNTKMDTVRLARQIVPVFGERTGAKLDGSPREQVKVFIQRGMLLMPALVMAQECEESIFLVERSQVEQPIVDACNQYLRDLYTSNIKLDALDHVEIFSVLQQMSFTSYGNTIFSNISLLIDNLEIQKDIPSRIVADFALVTYIDNLYLTTEQADELVDILRERYKVSSSRNIETILNRVTDEILATADNTMVLLQENDIKNVDKVIEEHNVNHIPKDSNINSMENTAKRKHGR